MKDVERLLAKLDRLATAFEEQNRMNAEHIAWVRETHVPDVGPDIVAIHRENAALNAAWIEEQRQALILQQAKQERMLESVTAVMLDNMKAHHSVMQETVEALCERVGLEKPDWERDTGKENERANY